MQFASPVEELSKLGFLVGAHAGEGEMSHPEGQKVAKAIAIGKWEPPERFLRFEIFSDIEGLPHYHYLVLFTYSHSLSAYRCWSFGPLQEAPAEMVGDFVNGALIMFSQPLQTAAGLNQLRITYTPNLIAGLRIQIDAYQGAAGYIPYLDIMLEPAE